MADTLDDLLEQWKIHGGWKPSKADFQRLIDEIERLRIQVSAHKATLRQADGRIGELSAEGARLREQNTGLGVRIQDAWKRIETLEEAGAAVVLDFDKGIPGDATPGDLIEALRKAVTRA